jgi:Uri superfamily endonuclease
MNAFPNTKGSYILVSRLLTEKVINIGALGPLRFGTGVYLYSGSAQGYGGLRARIAHHLRPSPRPTWHFDFLKPHLSVSEIWILETMNPCECRFGKFLAGLEFASQPARGFGSQDCRNQCFSHLVLFPPNFQEERLFRLINYEFAGLTRTEPNMPLIHDQPIFPV